jgi:hypothetical protein
MKLNNKEFWNHLTPDGRMVGATKLASPITIWAAVRFENSSTVYVKFFILFYFIFQLFYY